MLLLKGLWHGLRVAAAAVYWVMSIYYVWVALIFLGRNGLAALGVILLVAALYAMRFVLRRRLKDGGAGDVIAASVYLAVMVWLYHRIPV